MSGAISVKRSSTSSHWSTARFASSAVTMAPPGISGTPQTSVMSARLPCSPRQVPITSSLKSSFHSGLASASSDVKSACASKSEGTPSASANET